MPKKILFFIESLGSGGKERRFLELLIYLKNFTDFKMHVVTTEEEIHYTYIHKYNIPITVIKRRWFKKDPSFFFRFFKIAYHFKPDLFHTWGQMTTFYAIPAGILLNRPVYANLIANAKMNFPWWSVLNMVFKLNCHFAKRIISNSQAGIAAYGLEKSKKKNVVYNGVRLERFKESCCKKLLSAELGVTTKFVIVMVASFSKNKDFDFFLDVAKEIQRLRDDITFLGVGDGDCFRKMRSRVCDEKIPNVIFPGKRNDIEAIISISHIGVLFTNTRNHAEGISNSIVEYMALEKPVITTDCYGGSRELIEEGVSGFIMEPKIDLVVDKLNLLLSDEQLRKTMGKNGRKIVESNFSVQRMAEDFLQIYKTF